MTDRENTCVSVIIIFLDGEQFIEEAIRSVFAQSYPHWELLLVDDGSRDASTGIARTYAAEHSDRVRYLEHEGHENRGMSASRNLGIQQAHGSYLAFVDADDVLLEDKLEQQLSMIRLHPTAGMVYGTVQHWYSWSGEPELGKGDRIRSIGMPEGLWEPPVLFEHYLRGGVQMPAMCGVLVRRSAALAVGGFEESFRGMYEDVCFFSKLCLSFPVLVEHGVRARYRKHTRSCTRIAETTGEWKRGKQPNPAHLRYLEWLERYLRNSSSDVRSVHVSLQAQFRPYRQPVRHWLWRTRRRLVRSATRRARRLLAPFAV